MKNSIVKLALFCTVGLSTLNSCSKDDDSNSDSRNVKYEITGNATGTFDATYITGSGSGANEAPTALPWSKEIVVQAGIAKVIINSAVIGATPGKTITTKIFIGGVVKKEQSAVVQSNGSAIIAGLDYTFK
ncbi:MmpS family transport accessory protein [Pedobacter arcticus]|uniref:MmpS family transport accessory protein n=1 Tax=Pedobacter arcticus TaxID=752140 RepID=UPI000302A39A|nr:MmpS family transport accessory protein [Pedobacter arcticus]